MPKLYLKEWRKFLGCTLNDLSEMTGMNRGTLSDIETGKRPWSDATLDKIAGAFNVKGLDLLRDPTGAELKVAWDAFPKRTE